MHFAYSCIAIRNPFIPIENMNDLMQCTPSCANIFFSILFFHKLNNKNKSFSTVCRTNCENYKNAFVLYAFHSREFFPFLFFSLSISHFHHVVNIRNWNSHNTNYILSARLYTLLLIRKKMHNDGCPYAMNIYVGSSGNVGMISYIESEKKGGNVCFMPSTRCSSPLYRSFFSLYTDPEYEIELEVVFSFSWIEWKAGKE